MIWFIYNILFVIAFVLLLPKFFFRMWRRGGYRKGFLEHFAIYTSEQISRLRERRRIWIHAVSVGEVFVALRFIEELRRQESQTAFVLTTTTSTGHSIAAGRMNVKDVLLYFPLDFPFVVGRALKMLQPLAVILVESELWPNLIRLAAKEGIPLVLVNGRISERSAKGYRMAGLFFRRAINYISLLCVQSKEDERKLLKLGARSELIKVMGSGKYDIAHVDRESEMRARNVLKAVGIDDKDPLIVGGSTWPGEERVLLEVFKKLRESWNSLRLVLVPRHFERASRVVREIILSGLTFVRRSELRGDVDHHGGGKVDVLLVDTTGELTDFYACGTVVFVGKSLIGRGGQNIIEPALLGKPIVVGPHMENFPGVIDDFLAAEALVQVSDSNKLEEVFRSLIANAQLRTSYGHHARQVVERKRGSICATIKLIRANFLPLSH